MFAQFSGYFMAIIFFSISCCHFKELIIFCEIFSCILGIAVLCFAFATAFLVFFLATRHFRGVPLREVSLARRTTVFIVYTDDSKPHSDCIAILAKMLQHDANIDVFLDEFELKYSGMHIFLII